MNPTTTTTTNTGRHTRRLFEHVQARFGGLGPFLATDTQKVETIEDYDGSLLLSSSTDDHPLQRLVRHEITALHVKRFYHPPTALALGQTLAHQTAQGLARNWKVSSGGGSQGLESSDVQTLGAHPPYNTVTNNHEEDAYFEGVRNELRQRKWSDGSVSSPHSKPQLWPLDKLRLELDEAWPGGAGLAREPTGRRRRPFGGGLPRVMTGPTRWPRGFVHVDEMGPLSDTRGCFSANIYLQLPSDKDSNDNTTHAHLHVWPLDIRSRWDWYKNALLLSGLSSQEAEPQARLRDELGEPQVVRVEPGDLVLLCVQRPHAAVGFASGVRVSLQCFIQHQGPNERLLIDC